MDQLSINFQLLSSSSVTTFSPLYLNTEHTNIGQKPIFLNTVCCSRQYSFCTIFNAVMSSRCNDISGAYRSHRFLNMVHQQQQLYFSGTCSFSSQLNTCASHLSSNPTRSRFSLSRSILDRDLSKAVTFAPSDAINIVLPPGAAHASKTFVALKSKCLRICKIELTADGSITIQFPLI